jgi:hypothetical protein
MTTNTKKIYPLAYCERRNTFDHVEFIAPILVKGIIDDSLPPEALKVREADMMGKNILLMPYNAGGHWSLLFVDTTAQQISCELTDTYALAVNEPLMFSLIM